MSDAVGGEVRRTDRWRGLGGATLVAGAVGLFARRPALLLASAVCVALLAYARTVGPPPATLAVSRDVSDPDPAPGDEVTVTVGVENASGRTIPGLRFADGVPPGCAVVDGSASVATALRPGAAATLTYTLAVREGSRRFGAATAVTRDAVGVVERRATLDADAEGPFESTPAAAEADPPSLPADVARVVGREPVAASGDGHAFRTVREYRRGDPLSRIDWRRRARTGRLATVEFEDERHLTVMLVVDARPAATLAPDPASPTAVQRSVTASERLYAALTGAGHRVGVATLGPERRWLGPGRGDAHRRRVHDCLAEPTASARGDGGADPGAWLGDRLPETAVVVLLTPACDDAVAGLARRLDATGHPVTVVSPDPTATDTAGRRLARLERRQRLRRLRASGLPVLDWGPDVALATAMARAGWLS